VSVLQSHTQNPINNITLQLISNSHKFTIQSTFLNYFCDPVYVKLSLCLWWT